MQIRNFKINEEVRTPVIQTIIGWFGLILGVGLLSLPLKYLLKDTFNVTSSDMAIFFALANIPLYIKPVFGVISDKIPIFGSRRKKYLLLSLSFGGFTYLLLGLAFNYQYALYTHFVLNIFLVLISTILGALIVDYGQKYQITGKLSSLRVGVVKIAGLIVGPISGILVLYDFYISTLICAFLLIVQVYIHYKIMDEEKSELPKTNLFRLVFDELKSLFGNKSLLLAGVFVFLLNLMPGFNTPLFYRQTDVLSFSSTYIGTLTFLFSLGGLIGAVIYGVICSKFDLKKLLIFSILIDSADSLIYLFYSSEIAAALITFTNGFTGALAVIPIYDLAARATPKNSEALGYALIFSLWNFSDSISDVIGSHLYDNLEFGFFDLVWVNAATTFLILAFIPFLPKSIISFSDK